MAEGVAETVTGAMSGNGKKWVIGGAVLGLGYLWWTRTRTAKQPTGSAAITPKGAAVADPVTPAGGNYSPTPTTPARPSNNGEWLSQATAKLTAAPYNLTAIAVWNALNNALAGKPVSSAEAAIVERAMTVCGTPPEGMPPLNMAPPNSGGGGNVSIPPGEVSPPPPGPVDKPPRPHQPLPAPSGFRDEGPIWTNSIVYRWNAVPGASAYVLSDGGQEWQTAGAITGWQRDGLVHNGQYFTKIAAIDSGGRRGAWSDTLVSHTRN